MEKKIYTDDTVLHSVEVKKYVDVTLSNLISIFDGFLAYSNYWCEEVECVESDNPTQTEIVAEYSDCIEYAYAKCLLDGGKLKLQIEDEEEPKEITLQDIFKGVQLNILKRPFDPSIEEGDAVTMDCIIQYAVFGEIVYG